MSPKLKKLMEIEGYDNIEDLISATIADSVSPGICMNEGCNCTTEVEPDQDAGYCEECRTGTVKSVQILAGII